MSCAGAVRVDHCVSLFHLWWIPQSCSAAEGAYVAYRLQEMLSVLALESQQNRCLVIGEDLGTVPDALTEQMHQSGLYSYRVFYFEKDQQSGRLTRPNDYPASAVATVTTHDLPTLASWWNQTDIDLKSELDLLGKQHPGQLHEERARDKQRMLDTLRDRGFPLLPANAVELPELTAELNQAVHSYLASSDSQIMMSQIEDWLSMVEPVNIPGTSDEYPNWQRKLNRSIEQIFKDKTIVDLCRSISKGRQQSKT